MLETICVEIALTGGKYISYTSSQHIGGCLAAEIFSPFLAQILTALIQNVYFFSTALCTPGIQSLYLSSELFDFCDRIQGLCVRCMLSGKDVNQSRK
jgi:hypothetical protein